jgi:hypothetical protein
MDKYDDDNLVEKTSHEYSIKEVSMPVMDTREQWTYSRVYERIKEMQRDIDNIMKNNREHLQHLSEQERRDFLEIRKRAAHETRAFMKKYKEIDEKEIIDSEVVNQVLEVYQEYYAALEKCFGVGQTNGLSILLGKLHELRSFT